jgi:hypothetical protein
MKANLNRGFVVFISILAGLLIGLFAGAYIYYAWVPVDVIMRDAPPRILYHDAKDNTPQYRDLYVVRVANSYNGQVKAGSPSALQTAYDLLGVTLGDATFEQAAAMVSDAEVAARLENNKDGEGGRFSKSDELNIKNLRDALNALPPESRPKSDPSLSAPAIARNNARLVGLLLLLLWAALLGVVVYVVDHWVGARVNPVTLINQTFRVTPNSVMREPAAAPVAPSNVTVNVGPTSPGSFSAAPSAARAAVSSMPAEIPLATFAPTVYRHGDDHFDEDFAINGPMGELIGECGASIADRIGVDTPSRVSAIALWVFDKNDFQSTTKVLMTDYAYNDQVIRTKLKARGEAVLAVDGGVVEIVTSTLRVLIQVSDLGLNADNNPPHGYFQSVSLTFNVYKRQTA